MAQVAIVTDSTADLPAELRAELGIEMVPLTVHFGDQSFRDAVELDSAGFWRELAQSPVHPRSSQPSPADFRAVYERLAAAGRPVVSIHISSDLSGTYNSASLAKADLPGAEIRVVDSRSASMGIGLIVLDAARRARAGEGADAIARAAQEVAGRMQILFGVDTLDFLAKNGRIGRASALLGGLLSIKPILQVHEGVVAAADKVRGKAKVLPRCLEIMAERIPPGRRVRMGIMHAQAPDDAHAWADAFRQQYTVVESYVAPIGPVIAVHAGPGTLGVAMHEV